MKTSAIIIIFLSVIFASCGPGERGQGQQQLELQEKQQESEIPYNFRLQMGTLLNHYFELKDAIVEAEPDTAAVKANELSAWTYEVMHEVLTAENQGLWLGIARIIRNESGNLASESSTENQLIYFSRISNSVIQIADSFQPIWDNRLYRMECGEISGYSAVWLGREEKSENPYVIQSSEDCAEIVEPL